MRVVLFLLSGLAFLVGLGTSFTATSVFQVIVGLIAFVIWAILFSSAGIIEAVVNLKDEIVKMKVPAPNSVPGPAANGTHSSAEPEAAMIQHQNRLAWLVIALLVLLFIAYALWELFYAR